MFKKASYLLKEQYTFLSEKCFGSRFLVSLTGTYNSLRSLLPLTLCVRILNCSSRDTIL